MRCFLKGAAGSAALAFPAVYYCTTIIPNDDRQITPINPTFKDDCSGVTKLSVHKKVRDTWDKNGIDVYENEKKCAIQAE